MSFTSLKWKAKQLKTELLCLFQACRDPRTPWYAKGLVLALIAYALSPIDLIPDFIPVLGLIDDLIILPAGILIVLKMIPAEVITECREKAGSGPDSTNAKWLAAAVIVAIWLLGSILMYRLILHLLS